MQMLATVWVSLWMPSQAEDLAGDADASSEVVVEDTRSEGTLGQRSLDRSGVVVTPARSTDDLLRAMPGLHASAHGGQGKAYQYFLRGFDAVHGADLAVDVAGVPFNEPSHVHAHGYLDLHAVPTVLVRGASFVPGVSDAAAGDFAVAGSASLALGLEQPGGSVRVGAGSDRSAEATVAWRPERSTPDTFVVADAEAGEGVGMGRAYRQVRLAMGHGGVVGGARARVWSLLYDGAFESPGVLREDDVSEGVVDFWDAYPGSGGGRSSRVLVGAQVLAGSERGAVDTVAWAGVRSMTLDQNYTGYLEDPEWGDGSRQSHRAGTAGVRARAWRQLGAAWSSTTGGLIRVDRVHHQTDAITVAGRVHDAVSSLSAVQGEASAHQSLSWAPSPWLEVTPGLRGALYAVGRDDGAQAWASVLAPRLQVVVARDRVVSGWLAGGRGTRSPDVRGVGETGRAPVAVADSGELGAVLTPGERLQLRSAVFATRVSDEIVFDHVAARYLATGTTRRVGVDSSVVWRPWEAVRAEADLTLSDGRYVDSAEPIPYAPRVLGKAGVYVEQLPTQGPLVSAGVRAWALGSRPLTDGHQGTPTAVIDATTTVSWPVWSVTAELDNALGSEWRDGEFVYGSHWSPDTAPSQLPVRHLTAGAPRVARLSVARRF